MKPEEPNNEVPSFEKAKRRLKWKKIYSKKWFFPAVYLASAAIILTLAWCYQEYQTQQIAKTNFDTILPVEKVPINPTDDPVVLPITEKSQAIKKMGFYDEATSQKTRETSLVRFDNTYWPHSGMDFARKDGKTFDIVAALDGKVVRVENNPITGQLIEIQHESGIYTVYQSLDDLKVSKDQLVKTGEVLAKAGRNNFEKEMGVHLHFEIRNKEHQEVNPAVYFPDLRQ